MPRPDVDPDLFRFDRFALDEEWEKQVPLYWEHAQQLSEAREAYERAKACTLEVHARLLVAAASNPVAFGLEKSTADLLKAAVEVHEDYLVAKKKERRRRLHMDYCQAMVTTLEHRKRALENEVDLRLANYFAEPRKSRAAVQQQQQDKERHFQRKSGRT